MTIQAADRYSLVPPPDRRRLARAYSLLELFCVLMLLLAGLAISVPSLSQIPLRSSLRHDTKLLTAALRTLQLRSALIERSIEVRINGTDYYAYFLSDPQTLLIKNALSQDTQVQLNSPNGESIVFYAQGTSTPSRITLNTANTTCYITIGLRGRVASRCD